MEKIFRLYLPDGGFLSVKVIVKGLLRKRVVVIPMVLWVTIVDMETGRRTDYKEEERL